MDSAVRTALRALKSNPDILSAQDRYELVSCLLKSYPQYFDVLRHLKKDAEKEQDNIKLSAFLQNREFKYFLHDKMLHRITHFKKATYSRPCIEVKTFCSRFYLFNRDKAQHQLFEEDAPGILDNPRCPECWEKSE